MNSFRIFLLAVLYQSEEVDSYRPTVRHKQHVGIFKSSQYLEVSLLSYLKTRLQGDRKGSDEGKAESRPSKVEPAN